MKTKGRLSIVVARAAAGFLAGPPGALTNTRDKGAGSLRNTIGK